MLVQPDPGLIIWTIITFLLLFFILKSAAWKPLLSALDKREEAINNAIQKAESAKIEAEKILKENQEKLAQAETQSLKIIAEGKGMAEKVKNDIMQEAKSQADRIIKEAKAEIDKSKDSAIESLRKEISTLAIMAASKIVSENLDEKIDKNIVDKFIDTLPKNVN